MANMSYCRFHNTRMDMNDCINALERAEWGEITISEDEIRQCKYMFDSIMEYFDNKGILDENSWDAYEEWKESLDEWSEL